MGQAARPDPGLRGVIALAVGVGGLAMCITLLALGMRDVMDIGGFCAEGGPYVIAHPCPEGTVPATLLGTLGLFAFGAIAMVAGASVGGYGWLPVAGWTAVFAILGWNFLQYGLLDPPDGEIVWGWLISGVVFELMAWVPAVLVVLAYRPWSRTGLTGPAIRPAPPDLTVLPGPAQPARGSPPPTTSRAAAAGAGTRDVQRELAADMGALLARSAASAPVAGASASADGSAARDRELLDRLERLAALRERGLLDEAEYEAAKDAVIRDLEAGT